MLIGIDVGGTKIMGVVLDDDRTVLAIERRDTPSLTTGSDPLVTAMAGVVEALTDQVEKSASTIPLIGIGLPGLVDRDGRLRYAPNLAGLSDGDVGQKLHEQTGWPVQVDNDATCAMRAEHAMGATEGVDHAVLVTLGTGIGGGLVLDGSVMRGAWGFAGEIGHMVIDADGLACVCGRHGCWEQYASGSALGRMGRESAEMGVGQAWVALAGNLIGEVRGEHVMTAASNGDPEAVLLVGRFADWFAVGLANLVDILDVERCVIGGGLVAAGDTLLEPIRKSFTKRLLAASHRPTVEIVPARLGDRAGAIGAALLAGEACSIG
ncbi:MAG: ROK family protein [Acidimicrobiales bacterium]